MAFEELVDLSAGDYPLAGNKIDGINADPSAVVELLLKEKLMLQPRDGHKGIVPLALMYDPHKHIHYGSILIGAEHETELSPLKDQVLERLEKAGFLAR